MSGFDPGEGWREVDHVGPDDEFITVTMRQAGQIQRRHWVPEAPVRSLPTEPYTVIRVKWKEAGFSVLVRQGSDDAWTWVETQYRGTTAEVYQQGFDSFQVLSEPRTITAKAVIDRVYGPWTESDKPYIEAFYREFGVTS